MAELTGVNEEEHNQDSVIAPVNYSPEVEAAIQEVFCVFDHVRRGTCFAGVSQHRRARFSRVQPRRLYQQPISH